jgi:hypothetical protein
MNLKKLLEVAARADRSGIAVTRIGLIVVLLWIGSLKAFRYEADGIVPFVANSPFMSYFYADPESALQITDCEIQHFVGTTVHDGLDRMEPEPLDQFRAPSSTGSPTPGRAELHSPASRSPGGRPLT